MPSGWMGVNYSIFTDVFMLQMGEKRDRQGLRLHLASTLPRLGL